MFNKYLKVDYPFFKVVADGGMSIPTLGEGRIIPAIIIDVEDNIEVPELLKLHNETPPGDIELVWSLPATFFSKPKSVILNLTFLKPMKLSFGIDFSLERRHTVVDGIIQSRAVNLQVGKAGDKISTIYLDKAKQETHGSILIEVPNLGFDSEWNKLLLTVLKDKNRKQGLSKKESLAFANEQIKKMREMWNIRPKR